MQTRTTEKQLAVSRTAEIRELTKEAKQYFEEAEKLRGEVERGAYNALENAWQCGKRLIALKSLVGHGNWITFLENNWPELKERNAQLYMKIARENSKARRVADLSLDSVRKYRLSLVPEKDQPNKHRDVKLERLATLGNLVNEYERLRYRHINGLQRLDFIHAREETLELFQFLKWLHGDSDRNPWEEKTRARR